jgi:hypothetical protein
MHHHRINFDKYHPGYFGKVGVVQCVGSFYTCKKQLSWPLYYVILGFVLEEFVSFCCFMSNWLFTVLGKGLKSDGVKCIVIIH